MCVCVSKYTKCGVLSTPNALHKKEHKTRAKVAFGQKGLSQTRSSRWSTRTTWHMRWCRRRFRAREGSGWEEQNSVWQETPERRLGRTRCVPNRGISDMPRQSRNWGESFLPVEMLAKWFERVCSWFFFTAMCYKGSAVATWRQTEWTFRSVRKNNKKNRAIFWTLKCGFTS